MSRRGAERRGTGPARAAAGRLLGALLGVLVASGAAAQTTRALVTGELERVVLDSPGDHWSGGVMVVGGQSVIIPRNLLIDLPANRLTLQQLFEEAPPGCEGTTGLAKVDPCRQGEPGAQVTLLANRLGTGQVIAGEAFLSKGVESFFGTVTFIDHTAGSFRIDGVPGSATTGTLVRLNDPESRHTLQQGPGCVPGAPNCSADPRFGVDPENYTAAFVTGYPMCLPSTRLGGARTVAAGPDGAGDPLCPVSNRGANPVPDSTRFAPLRVGDSVLVEGNYERVGDLRFLSAWHLEVQAALTTRDDPTQPDYLTLAETVWDAPAFENERARFLLIGFTTLGASQLDAFGVYHDRSNDAHEVPVASTVGNPDTINQGLPPNAGHIFKVRYDVDFFKGADGRSPCQNLANAGLSRCPPVPTLADEFSVLSPNARELVARSRHVVNPGVTAVDVLGRPANFGQYLTPVGVGHPEFVEIDLAATSKPLAFTGEPWNMDRRLGPGGCEGTCESSPQPLDPFPFEGYDPRTQASIPVGAQNRMFEFFPFGPGNRVSWPPPLGTVPPVFVPPPLGPVCSPEVPPQVVVTGVAPSSAAAGTAGEAVISGSGFTPDATCSFGAGIEVACEVESLTRLRAVFHVLPTATPGPRDVSVTAAGGTATLPGGFEVLPGGGTCGPDPVLVITAVAPPSLPVGGAGTVLLAGRGFTPGMTCSFGAGITVTSCTVASSTAASAQLQVAAGAAVGPRDVQVTLPDGASATLAGGFAVTPVAAPPPALLAVTPPSAQAGTSLGVTLSGTGFQPGMTCAFGAGITVTSCTVAGPTSASAALQVAADAAAGPRAVVVTNPDGQSSTLAGGFAVTVAPGPDTAGPVVTAPVVHFAVGSRLSTVTATPLVSMVVEWTGTDPSGVTGYELERSRSGGSWVAIPLASPTATSVAVTVTPGESWRYRVRAVDGLGNVSPYAVSEPFVVRLVQETDPAARFVGRWSSSAGGSPSLGAAMLTGTAGATATFTFTGREVAWVGVTGTDLGSAEVRVDGTLLDTVNLFGSTILHRVLIFAQPVAPGSHTFTVVSAGGGKVKVDAYLVLE